MKVRIISALIVAGIIFPIVYISGLPLVFLIGILAILGYKEITDLNSKTPNLIKVIGLFFLLFLTYFNYTNLNLTEINVVKLLLPVILLIIPALFYGRKYTIKDSMFLIGFILFLGIAFNSLLYTSSNLIIFAYLLTITILGDTFAMLFGMLIGKHKLSPKISPNKTLEGSIGGLLVAVITSIIVYINLIDSFSISLLIVTVILAVSAQFGDLIFSKIKREYKIKDFSNIMPGHGGILDRLDSILLVSMIYIILEVFL